MFCEECGSPLREGDKSCRVCGYKIPQVVEATDSIPTYQENPQSQIKIDEAISEHDVALVEDQNVPEDSDLQTQIGDFAMSSEPKKKETDDIPFEWNLSGFPKPRKTEEVNFNWNIDSDGDGLTKAFDESAPDLTDELDRYFTFDKSAEDFQKVLDEEYEKIKDYSQPIESRPYIERMNLLDRINSEDAHSEPGSKLVEGPEPQLESEAQAQTELIHEGQAENFSENDEEDEPEVIWISHTRHTKDEPAQTEDVPGQNEEAREPSEEALDRNQEVPVHTENAPEENGEPVPLWFESQEEEVEVKRSSYIGRAILILIIAVLLAEAAILGIQYFLPESKAAEKAGEINGIVSETLIEWKDRTVNFFKGVGGKEETGAPVLPEDEQNDQQPGLQEEEEPDSQPDTTPVADKKALISAASGLNKNIAAVEANDSLAWQSGKDYAIADIENSKPIENNYWFTDPGGEHVYFDKEIVATLVDFDSKWAEYVNGGSSDVIHLTKEGSQAYKNATTFSKVGKVEQTFLLLQIGEIRQGEDAFYAWTYEEIKEVQGGKTTIKKYNWIYRLEPIDGEMKITNYYNY
jgi:hypothetical protein